MNRQILIREGAVKVLVEFSAVANYRWSNSLASLFLICPVCSVVTLLSTMVQKQPIRSSSLMIIGGFAILSLVLYVWARCKYSLDHFRKIESKKFQDMLYEAEVNCEINDMIQE